MQETVCDPHSLKMAILNINCLFVLFLVTVGGMTNATNRPPLGNIDTSSVGTPQSNRNETKPRHAKAATVDAKFKKSFYNLFDAVFERVPEEDSPVALTRRMLFSRLNYEETKYEVFHKQIRSAICFLSRAVPCIAKLIVPYDPASVIKGLYNSLTKYFEPSQAPKVEIEALLAKHQKEIEALSAEKDAAHQKELAETKRRWLRR